MKLYRRKNKLFLVQELESFFKLINKATMVFEDELQCKAMYNLLRQTDLNKLQSMIQSQIDVSKIMPMPAGEFDIYAAVSSLKSPLQKIDETILKTRQHYDEMLNYAKRCKESNAQFLFLSLSEGLKNLLKTLTFAKISLEQAILKLESASNVEDLLTSVEILTSLAHTLDFLPEISNPIETISKMIAETLEKPEKEVVAKAVVEAVEIMMKALKEAVSEY